MKVQITNRTKQTFTMAEAELAQRMVEEAIEDESSVEEYALMAARLFLGNSCRVLECSASVAKNCRVQDNYFEGSGTADVWIDFIAFDSYHGAVEGGAYLTDLWQIGSDEANAEVRSHCYVNGFGRNGHYDGKEDL